MLCPRCSHTLVPGPLSEAGVPVDALRCPTCGGRWLESTALARVQDTVEVRLVEVRHLPDAAAQAAPLRCPACAEHGTLRKVVAERDQHVVMDVCGRCEGTWLDAGELEAIREEGLASVVWSTLRWLART